MNASGWLDARCALANKLQRNGSVLGSQRTSHARLLPTSRAIPRGVVTQQPHRSNELLHMHNTALHGKMWRDGMLPRTWASTAPVLSSSVARNNRRVISTAVAATSAAWMGRCDGRCKPDARTGINHTHILAKCLKCTLVDRPLSTLTTGVSVEHVLHVVQTVQPWHPFEWAVVQRVSQAPAERIHPRCHPPSLPTA